jgi:GTP-binding protein
MLPKVVIVGRPNVGKSSLLNMLAGRRISIVDAIPGVTRDRISAYVELPVIDAETGKPQPRAIELIDTGGHGIEDTQQLTADVERQIARGLGEASLVLFVIDAQTGIAPLDREVAQLLRVQAGRTPVLLVANKVDDEKYEAHAQEAYELGLGEPVMVSATNRYRKRDFIDAIAAKLPDELTDAAGELEKAPEAGVLLAVVGKRNAGKSTLVNTLAGDERVIVSEVEGTTRDSIDVRIEIEGKPFTLIDTAGVRKRKSIAGDIEFYSHHRALRSIRRADVVLLLIDSTVPVSQVDKQLGHEVLKHFKPCVVVVNKWDLAREKSDQDAYVKYLDEELKGFSFAPIAFTSAKTGEGVRDLVAMSWNLYQQAGHRVTTGELNRIVEDLINKHPPAHKRGRRGKVYYVTQASVHPPTIALFVNEPDLFDHNYQRYIENRLREELPYSEVPIQLLVRGRQREEVDR